MSHSTIALITLAIVLVLCITDRIPLLITMMSALLVLYFCGVMSFSDAMSGFSSTIVPIQIGVAILSAAFINTGLTNKIGPFLIRLSRYSQKRFILLFSVFASLASIAFNAFTVAILCMSIIDQVVSSANGTISRKMCYLPVVIAATYGGLLNSISLTSSITASSLLAASSFGRGYTFFEPAKVALPSIILFLVIYALVGYRLSEKWFTFDEIPVLQRENTASTQPSNRSALLTCGVFLLCLAGFIFTKFNVGLVALAGGMLLIITKCITLENALKSINWNSLLVVASSIGFAKGIEVSGAGNVVADTIITLAGPIGQSPYGTCIIILFTAALISNFMSDNSAIVLIAPIAFSFAETFGISPLPYILACTLGANTAISTPLSTAAVTTTLSAGYRVIDYIRFGGLFNVLAVASSAVMLRILYF